MVDKPTFPLYRLPYVALKVAFGCSHPHDIKKLKKLNVRFNSVCNIWSDCLNTIFNVNSSSELSAEDSKLEAVKIRDTSFQVKMDECIHILNFYCGDRLACLTTLYEYLTDFYGMPLYEVEVDGDSMMTVDGVLARQQTLARCYISCSKSGDEEVRWFLDRIKNRVTRLLVLNVKTSENFRLNFRELNSRGLVGKKTSLTCENLNSYLKEWLSGEKNPKLGYLELKLNLINVDTVLNGIEFIHRHHQNDIYYWCVNSSSEVSPQDSKLESLKIKDTVLQIKMDEYVHLSFYCIDRLACLTILYEYLTDFYEVPLYEVELDGDSMRALDGVLARQETLPVCRFSCSKIGDEEVRWFLDRIENRLTQCLILNATTSKSFRLNLRQPIKTDLICFGRWHTLSINNFNELNCRGMIVQKTRLTCENLNSYLKKWVIGEGNPNLGCLELRLNSINVDAILNGIEFIHRHHQNNVYYGFNMGSFSWEFKESYEIKRNDGTIASIVMQNEQNGEFKLCVWPDVFGNVYPEVE
ncbi:unnamed protein product [Caenorhabditis brenneri]